MEQPTSPNSVCESCGAEFHCGAVAQKCWCFQVDLSPENLEELRADYQKCLCRNCLENLNSDKNKSHLSSATIVETA